MPCDGVAVATGEVPLDLARYLAPGTVRPALVAFLAGEFAGLGASQVVPSAEGSLTVLLGAYTVTLRGGRIEAGGPAGPILEQLRSRVAALLIWPGCSAGTIPSARWCLSSCARTAG